jgi:hypothetical protein|nr:MAG TPA: hypothetical protein [Caudoviricetes sp.]
MDVCDCRCDDKVITGKYCDKNESQEDIKRAGDIIKDSEQCDVVPNTQKGVFRLWCRLRKIIKTICDVLQRMVCLQKKIKSLCVTLHCMKANIIEANSITVKRNKDMIKKYKQKEPNTPNDKKGIYNEAKAIYEEQLVRLAKAKKRLEEMKKDPTVEEVDGIFVSGDFDSSRTGSFSYFSKLSLATSKDGVDYASGGITFDNNTQVDYYSTDLYPGISTTLTRVGRTSSGKTINLRVTINSYELSSHAQTESSNWIIVRNGDGAIRIHVGNYYKVTGTFEFLDESDQPINLMVVNAVNDIDYRQGFWASFNNSKTLVKNPPGSRLVMNGGYISAEDSFDAKNESSIPLGSLVYAGVGTKIDWEIIANHPGVNYIDTDGGGDNNWWMDFFGNDFEGETVDLHEPPKPIPPIEECDLMSCDFDCLGDN